MLMPISIAIVEDDAGLAGEISEIVSDTPDFKLVCCCRNMAGALETIPPLAPDVVIMDIKLPDGSGIQATEKLKRLLPDTEVMIFTIYENTGEIFQAIKAGANGYLLKRAGYEEIVTAIRNLMKGEVPMTGEIARKVMQSFRKPQLSLFLQNDPSAGKLTPRETEILQLLTKGFQSKEIASNCAISLETVNSHLKKIYEKLRVHSRTEAVVKFLKNS